MSDGAQLFACIYPSIGSDKPKNTGWFDENTPRFTCPDQTMEGVFGCRLEICRRHIHKTEDGCAITEFRPDFSRTGKLNAIPCAPVHHIREGRWVEDHVVLDQYTSRVTIGRLKALVK